MYDLILVDFSWLYNRYYFVAKNKSLESKEEIREEITRMLSAFLNTVKKNQTEAKVFLVLDPPTSSLNNFAIYKEYKQNRDKEAKKDVYDQFKNIVKSLVNSLDENTFVFVRALGYEADQVISYLAQKHNTKNTVIFSGDKDLLQLSYFPNVSIADKYEKGSFLVKTDEEIFAKFKNSKGEDFTRVSSNKRDILKYRTLKGDPSDNLSPVFCRIKDKEIISIIQNYWIDEDTLSEERISDIIDDIEGDDLVLAGKLRDNADIWLRNYKIMSLYDLENLDIKRIK